MNKSIPALSKIEQLNFLLTNRIPRRLSTQFIGWFSKIENPIVAKISIFSWSLFAEDLRLKDAKKRTFTSLQDCFIRELKPGLRPIDQAEDIVSSPCDAIIGECGNIQGKTVLQAKGFPYELNELIPDGLLCEKYKNGTYVTLRLKSSMYHRFHAPVDCNVKKINYLSGDTWNVNPIALKKVEKLFCKNERAILELNTGDQTGSITLVPVAAILVACMKFNFIPDPLDLIYKGPNYIHCNADFSKGDEMGYFQHGSTIILFASKGYQLAEGIQTGKRINMGEPLLSGHKKIR
jgi:phosphatidylserine decarboxylase